MKMKTKDGVSKVKLVMKPTSESANGSTYIRVHEYDLCRLWFWLCVVRLTDQLFTTFFRRLSQAVVIGWAETERSKNVNMRWKYSWDSIFLFKYFFWDYLQMRWNHLIFVLFFLTLWIHGLETQLSRNLNWERDGLNAVTENVLHNIKSKNRFIIALTLHSD